MEQIPVSSRPLISIVLSTYNGAEYLRQQIESILAQTYGHLELIVTDDASTDKTPSLIHQYAQKDNRVVALFHDKNRGININLGEALLHAKGDYVAISDQDDVWSKDKLDLLLKHIGANAAIYSDSMLIDSNGAVFDKTLLEQLKKHQKFSGNNVLGLLHANYVSGHAILLRRELLDYCLPFTEEIMYDHQLAIVACVYGGLAAFDRPLVFHRIHKHNQTNRILDRLPNGTQPNDPLLKKKNLKQNTEAKIARRLEKRRNVINAIEFACAVRQRLSSQGKATGHPDQETLDLLLAHYKNFNKTLFDFSFFLLLLKYKNQLFFHLPRKRLQKCIKTAKGEKWYRYLG